MFFNSKVKIKLLGREGVFYSDPNHKINLDSEFLVGDEHTIVIYLSRLNGQRIAKNLEPLAEAEIA
ncbi:hypothetical protein ACXYUI_30750, partial [Klebsiella pneumoniae]